MQKQVQLSRTGNNLLELAITIKQHLNHSRTREINPKVRPKLTATVYNRLEASSTLQNHQEPYITYQNNAKAAKSILNWLKPS